MITARQAADTLGMSVRFVYGLGESGILTKYKFGKGVSLNTVGEVLGHRSAASTRRYAHLQTGAKGAALAMVGKKVA